MKHIVGSAIEDGNDCMKQLIIVPPSKEIEKNSMLEEKNIEEDDIMQIIFLDASAFKDFAKTDYNAMYNHIIEMDKTLEIFITSVRNIIPPQPGEANRLVFQARKGNKYARNRLIEMYLRVALKLALKSSENYNWDIKDAIGEGCLSLVQAVDKALIQYDSHVNSSFGSYISWYIYRYIERVQPTCRPLIYYPNSQRNLFSKVYKTLKKNYLVNEFGVIDNRDASDFLKINFGYTDREIYDVLNEATPFRSFEVMQDLLLEYDNISKSIKGDDDLEIFFINTTFDGQIEENAESILLKEAIKDVSSCLTGREQKVVSLRYGFRDGQTRTLEEVAHYFNVVSERIRTIENKALSKLRNWCKRKLSDYNYTKISEKKSVQKKIKKRSWNHEVDIITQDKLIWLKEEFEDVFSCLTDREQKILNLRFGLENGQIYPEEKLGEYFNVNLRRICQIEGKALLKLRQLVKRQNLDDNYRKSRAKRIKKKQDEEEMTRKKVAEEIEQLKKKLEAMRKETEKEKAKREYAKQKALEEEKQRKKEVAAAEKRAEDEKVKREATEQKAVEERKRLEEKVAAAEKRVEEEKAKRRAAEKRVFEETKRLKEKVEAVGKKAEEEKVKREAAERKAVEETKRLEKKVKAAEKRAEEEKVKRKNAEQKEDEEKAKREVAEQKKSEVIACQKVIVEEAKKKLAVESAKRKIAEQRIAKFVTQQNAMKKETEKKIAEQVVMERKKQQSILWIQVIGYILAFGIIVLFWLIR